MAAVRAVLDVTAERCSPAGHEIVQHVPLRHGEAVTPGGEELGAVGAQDVGDLQRRPRRRKLRYDQLSHSRRSRGLTVDSRAYA